ncbi:Pc24g01490 [Penicillium rubens Wisconsin 54-1255]|uniref:Pc24g01490 protein n=1 Tax=Penicillium rubens (strain ATCC 28089 / DSM 1075 / NRRL 1951 / Wisconsin 54-1255) TaxID=500485 RepID=B6HWU0_PENRW|nr:Pc24g01490 [Penicillium rubens Wisconsin 54-1255]
MPGIDAPLCILPTRIIDYLRAIANAKFFMHDCRSLHAHGQLCNQVASRPSYTCSLRICPALAGSMLRERGKHLLLLSPAQPLPQLDQHDGPSLPKVNPPTPAATPVHNLDSRVLPSWSDAGHSIWRHNKLDTTSLHCEYRVDHGVIQAYHCSPGSHYHAPMLLRDRDMPSLCLSHETDRPLESTSIPCLPPLGPCHLRQLDSSQKSNVVEPSLPAVVEVGPIPSRTGIASTWMLDQSQEQSQVLHDTTMCVNDHSLLDCHVSSRQHGHNLNVENQKFDLHERRFKCKIIGCRMGFKREDHLERHTRNHLKEKPYVCWVPCHRAFSRRDNLKVHCTKTHMRHGGRNRYVATLDETSPDYDPEFRGQLSFDGRPLRFLARINSVPEAKPLQP